jgi:hypothetical protein
VLRLITAVLVAALPVLAPAAPSAPRKPKLAVTEIAAPSGDVALSAALSELALTEASAGGRYAVIGQSDVKAMLGQALQRQMMGCKDSSECFAEIGGALGVDHLLVCTVGLLGARWRIDVKLVDVKKVTALARAGESVDPRPELVAAAIQRGVRAVIAATTPPTVTPRQRAGWITAGVGGACLAGSAVFGLLARSASKDLQAASAAGDAGAWERQRSLLRSRALTADVLLGVGLAGAGTGAWLVFGGGDAPRVRVSALPDGAALAVEGRF